MLSFPQVPSPTSVFYFKLPTGRREEGSELGESEREREKALGVGDKNPPQLLKGTDTLWPSHAFLTH